MEPGATIVINESHRQKHPQTPLPIGVPLIVAKPGKHQAPHEVAVAWDGELWYIAVQDVEEVRSR